MFPFRACKYIIAAIYLQSIANSWKTLSKDRHNKISLSVTRLTEHNIDDGLEGK